jgi:hypothetical protein
MIGFIDAFFAITLNYNHLQQLIVNDCLRLAPLLPGLRVSYCDWLGSDLWISHLTKEEQLTNDFSFTNESLRLTSEFPYGSITAEAINYTSSLYNSGMNWIQSTISNISRYCMLIRCRRNVLASRCLSMDVFCGAFLTTLPAFRRHVTIFTLQRLRLFLLYNITRFGLTDHHQVYKLLD